MANSSILQSTATFERQAKNVELPAEWIAALKASGIDTLGKLSYAVTIPGTPVTEAAMTTFTTSIRPGVAVTIAAGTALKRLVFESQTFAVQALKHAVQSTDTDTTKKLAAPERISRVNKLKADYPGIDISGAMEPSHYLYDLCMTIFESEEIRYIPPSKCLSRQQELAGEKPEKEVQLHATKGQLVVKDANLHKEISLTSDLALFQAFERRALAFDVAGLASYTVVHKWHNRLFGLLAQPPAPGFAKISQAQLLRADRQSFVRMGEKANGSLKPDPAGVRPLDAIIEDLYNDVSVSYFLLPLPLSSHDSAKDSSNKSSSSATKPANKRDHEDGSNPGGTKNKFAKGKGKSKTKRDPMPQGLRGMWSRTKDGKPICFSYNLGKCTAGDKCPREHICCVPNCGKAHPQTEHS